MPAPDGPVSLEIMTRMLLASTGSSLAPKNENTDLSWRSLICIKADPLRLPYKSAMVDALVVRPLERRQIAQAFPLVRAILPETSLSRWTDFARTHTHERAERAARGIMAAQNQGGYIAGIFTHEARDELALGRTLTIGNLMVADFPGRDGTVDYLIDGMDSLANLRGCVAITVDLDIAFFGGLPTSGW